MDSNHQRFVKLSLLMTAVLCLVGFCGFLSAAEKPNIVVILVDDMGWSDIGCRDAADRSLAEGNGRAFARQAVPRADCSRPGTRHRHHADAARRSRRRLSGESRRQAMMAEAHRPHPNWQPRGRAPKSPKD